MRSGSDREHSSQLAVPARSSYRRLCANSESLHRMTKRGTTLKRKSAAPQGRGALTMELSLARRMPAEWERHEATWIAWPHHEPDWPGKLAPIPWVYSEIVRALSEFERVEVLCHNDAVAENARKLIATHGVKDGPDKYRLHIAPNDRVWLSDSAPTVVSRAVGDIELIDSGVMACGKYVNYSKDGDVGKVIVRYT